MGLDISAYSRLESVGLCPDMPDGWCVVDDHIRAYVYDCFPASFRGVPVLRQELYGHEEFLDGGCYRQTPATVSHGFRAGSYGGYGLWRRDLADQFNPAPEERGADGLRYSTEPDPALPFYELIWFADNEGTLGPETCADLLGDFRQCEGKYSPALARADYAVARYRDWMRAVELGADGGLVVFH